MKEEREKETRIRPPWDGTLEAGSREVLKETMFGKDAVIKEGGKQDKFLKSWIEMGYPYADRGRQGGDGRRPRY